MARWYEVLGVHETASSAEVQAAFRRLSLEHHPSRSPDGSASLAQFRAIQVAYQEWQSANGVIPRAGASSADPEENDRVLRDVLSRAESLRRAANKPESRLGSLLLYGVLALMLVAFLVVLLGRALGRL